MECCRERRRWRGRESAGNEEEETGLANRCSTAKRWFDLALLFSVGLWVGKVKKERKDRKKEERKQNREKPSCSTDIII